ncbi:hypothetical protein IWW36_003772 [Coemansia brasiliensis]|uniref:Uncharacterized protein n=1 Tax=Coemansia brasiliensis TaxID=2650707 RepID=A0A9W8I742_9FUNG|nr:hypothetical protein IWW36_003772 [Coemansia brasiliensis]
MPHNIHTKLPLQRPRSRRQRRPSRCLGLRTSPMLCALPTPPEDGFPSDMRRTPDEDISVSSPSGEYPHMTLAEKVHEANTSLVHRWGRFLVGAGVSELFDGSVSVVRLVSVIELPSTFCISPADEPLCPSDDPSRIIIVVSPAGLIVDAGIFDLDGPVFYRGQVVNNRYIPLPSTR